jgi:hypothetical protein
VKNFIQPDDTIAKSQALQQTDGVLQGDPLSPLLFIIATADITKAIQNETNVKFYTYGDDMVVVTKSAESLQTRWPCMVYKNKYLSFLLENCIFGKVWYGRNITKQ